jgi:hypothetical protein
MSRFWPHTPYAEDQPLAAPILTAHVLSRGFQGGALLGPVAGTARYYFSRLPRAGGPSFSTTLLRTTGTTSLASVGIIAAALAARMHGKEHIEWADRSWRLLENKGQVEVDDWSLGGAVAGAVATAGRRPGWLAVTGGSAMGSLVGVGGYLVWRYGVKGGKWEEV